METPNSPEPSNERTLSSNTAIQAAFSALPIAQAPLYPLESDNGQIVLHEGKVTVVLAGITVESNGTIIWSMRRSPTLFAFVEYNVPSDASPDFRTDDGTLAASVEFNDLPGSPAFQAEATALHAIPGSKNGLPVRLGVPVTVGADKLVQRVVFHVLNVPAFQGFGVNRSTDDRFEVGYTRLRFDTDGIWHVLMDRVPNDKKVYEDLDNDGGIAVTHIGTIEHLDGTLVKLADVDGMLTLVGFALSFCSGQWSLPFLRVGLDDDGNQQSFSWRAPRTSNWNSKYTWYPRSDEYALQQFLTGFSSRWHEAAWEQPIRIAINWYIQALDPDTLDTGIVLAHAALEVLAYTLAVEAPPPGVDPQIPGKYNRESADVKVDRLLKSLGVTTIVPSHMSDLLALVPTCRAEIKPPSRQSTIVIEGPFLISYVRNAVLHGNRLSQLIAFSTDTRLEAWQLSVWYLELAILKLCGYSGQCVNRVSPNKWYEEVLVP